MSNIVENIKNLVWGVPTMVTILALGIYLSIKTKFIQIRLLPRSLKLFWRRMTGKDENCSGVSPYQAFCTALAATVGTGNLAGVAGAIALGGPGSIFWMWVCAVLGMVIKFSEVLLSVLYRKKSENGEWLAGPMYVIKHKMGKRWHFLAYIYCFFGVVAAFGVGNATQINTVISGINSVFSGFGVDGSIWGNFILGVGFAILIGFVLLGGVKKIGSLAERLVPVVSMLYIIMCVGVLIVCRDRIGSSLYAIIKGAFDPKAVTGGILASVMITLRTGISRGIFTNEAGMGTAGIAHGCADIIKPIDQAMMGIVEVFLDTIVICTLTGLVILCSGAYIPYGFDEGILLTERAFASIYGQWISIPLSLIVCCLALATVLGWGLYGGRCAQFLFGNNAWRYFCYLQIITIIIGAMLKTATVWQLAEIVNGLMMIPNMIALIICSKDIICHSTKEINRLN